MVARRRPDPSILALEERTTRYIWIGSLLLFHGALFSWAELYSADWSRPLTWLWFAVLLAAQILAIDEVVSSARWHGLRLVPGADALRIYRAGRLQQEIAYEAIAGYRFDFVRRRQWLTLDRNDGAPSFIVEHVPFSGIGDDRRKLVQALGPRLDPSAVQDRGARPVNELDAYLFDHYWNPPIPIFRVGERYRYVAPEALVWSRAESNAAVWYWIGGFLVAPVGLLQLFHPSSAVIAWAVPPLALLGFLVFRQLLRRASIREFGHDRIEILPDGLKITRGGLTWTVSGPAIPETGPFAFRILGQDAVRYGRGTAPYYLVPAFLVREG